MTRLRRHLAVPVLVLGLGFGALACGSDDGPSATATTTSAATVSESTTTEAPTTTTEPRPDGAATPADAAHALYQAWVDDDREAAARVALPEAIDSMWTAVHGPYELYRHCDDGEFDTSGCLFRDRSTNHTIQISLERRDGVWVIVGTFYSEE